MASFRFCVIMFWALVELVYSKPPNIVFIVADDLGWNDVGFRNPDMITPNIDKMAREGVILNQNYVQPVCSPTRGALLSGIYPFKVGLQHIVIGGEQAVCLPLNKTILPQELKKLGYATHIVGKWHLGFCSWECTPTYRGFDSFLGYYNSREGYFDHKFDGYLDWRNNTATGDQYKGVYSTVTVSFAMTVWQKTKDKLVYLGANESMDHIQLIPEGWTRWIYTKRIQQIINNHNKKQPVFLYLPFQNVHSPTEVPKIYEDRFPHVVNKGRRIFSGMVNALDESIGNITDTLKQKGLFDDTLFVFTADNGGEIYSHGNNWPLRGGKHSIWEGGTRVTAFMYGKGLKKPGHLYNGMVHAVDWMPTLLSAAGGTPVPNVDGVDQWKSISNLQESKRTEFIYNLDDFAIPLEGQAGIRMGRYKLLLGYPGTQDGWHPPMNRTKDDIYEERLYDKDYQFTPQLFDLVADPTERHDLSSKLPDVVEKLKTRILEYKKHMVPANYPKGDPKGDPRRYGNIWTPGWC